MKRILYLLLSTILFTACGDEKPNFSNAENTLKEFVSKESNGLAKITSCELVESTSGEVGGVQGLEMKLKGNIQFSQTGFIKKRPFDYGYLARDYPKFRIYPQEFDIQEGYITDFQVTSEQKYPFKVRIMYRKTDEGWKVKLTGNKFWVENK